MHCIIVAAHVDDSALRADEKLTLARDGDSDVAPTPATKFERLPPNVPNMIDVMHAVSKTYDYLMERKSKLFLYFGVSACIGLIIILTICVAQLCARRFRPQTPDSSSRCSHLSMGSVAESRTVQNAFGSDSDGAIMISPNVKLLDHSVNDHSPSRE